jgi:membrane-bound lytic murein transglycosylase A
MIDIQLRRWFNLLLGIGFCFLLLTGCAGLVKTESTPVLRKLSIDSYPRFSDDMYYDGLAHGITKSISYLKRFSGDKTYTFGNDFYTADHLIRSLNHFLTFIQHQPDVRDMNRFIRKYYQVYQAVGKGNPGKVFYTGYYEPLLQGSLRKSRKYPFPVYPRPDDLVKVDLSLFSIDSHRKTITGRRTDHTLVPYFSRKEIDVDTKLFGKVSPIAWVDNPVDLFFLHIQGSGKLYLDNGNVLNLHYHTTNGQPYRSIGKLLIDTDKIPRSEMSMQRIRSYLKTHPEKIEKILSHNPSYVFFKTEPVGPKGFLDVVLTPGRSIALDRRLFPHAGLAYIKTQKPIISENSQIHHWAPLTRFALNQDTGGVIRGPGRADLFWGNGPYAEIAAGHMQHMGDLYFLVLKPEK